MHWPIRIQSSRQLKICPNQNALKTQLWNSQLNRWKIQNQNCENESYVGRFLHDSVVEFNWITQVKNSKLYNYVSATKKGTELELG